ncbi:MAG: PQQ-binding-like beta-propeller repeat protein [Planctomycetes bacterium]|nr:PQQ-binding-like beta-propeller repeat protein [Planctomycetota bacterium]
MSMKLMMAALIAAMPALAVAAPDELDGPWATYHADNAGTSSSDAIPYSLGTGPIEVAWKLDVRAEGQDRVAGRNPITFDSEGNLYWKTSIGGGTAGVPRIVSVDPEGQIRWVANDDAGEIHGLGTFYDATAPVIGKDAVYAIGGLPDDEGGWLFIAAYEKATGTLIWQSALDDAVSAANNGYADLLTPVLYQGKLYVVAPDIDSLLPRLVLRLDAADGAIDWVDYVDGVMIRISGQMAFVPDAFAPGEHGLYFNGDSGNGADGIPEVYGIHVLDNGAELAWSSEGGKVARSHVVYSEATGTLYTHTWADYGGQLYSFAPDIGLLAANVNLRGTGHGFYDVGCLEFDGEEIIAGGFEGLVIRYIDVGNGVTQSEVAYDDANLSGAFWGEYRVFGQLLQAPDGHSVLITGTNSDTDSNPTFSARVVAIDVTAGELLWEFDTGIVQNHGYTIRGGPYAGPDGKVYYFDAVTGELVALKGPQAALPRFIRGDTDGSGNYTIGDGVQILERLFANRAAFGSDCDDTGDLDDNGVFTIGDAVWLFNYLFAEGELKKPPFPPAETCGEDPTPDDGEMGCNATSPACQ